jgi:hypothetical protein
MSRIILPLTDTEQLIYSELEAYKFGLDVDDIDTDDVDDDVPLEYIINKLSLPKEQSMAALRTLAMKGRVQVRDDTVVILEQTTRTYLSSKENLDKASDEVAVSLYETSPFNLLGSSLDEMLKGPGVHSLSSLLTFNALSVLIISPFFQGLCYGLGEGIGRIYIGRWVGLDPETALMGRPVRKQQGPGMFTRCFQSLFPSRETSATVKLPSQ